jgi:hypothetical protein
MWEEAFLQAALDQYKCFLHIVGKSKGIQVQVKFFVMILKLRIIATQQQMMQTNCLCAREVKFSSIATQPTTDCLKRMHEEVSSKHNNN